MLLALQRMRERNNEASKRCRLKRRMKAECMENQASLLTSANRMLKARITRLENVGAALREGVRMIQSGQCACDLTANKVWCLNFPPQKCKCTCILTDKRHSPHVANAN